MRETIEFRIPEGHAERLLPADAGVRSGLARKVALEPGDPLLDEIGRLDRELRAEGRALFTAWKTTRRYSRRELDEAELFNVWPRTVFEPAGEECGTAYDDSRACPECGAGAPQVGPLVLDGRRIPRNVDFARTIAGELVVSRRVVDAFGDHDLTGAELEPVRLANAGRAPSPDHRQLRVAGPAAELAPATRAGENPFDDDGYGRCSRGHVVGLSLLSEAIVRRSSVSGHDVLATRDLVGVRRGLLRPRPLLLFSPRAREAVERAKLRGLVVEVARVS